MNTTGKHIVKNQHCSNILFASLHVEVFSGNVHLNVYTSNTTR